MHPAYWAYVPPPCKSALKGRPSNYSYKWSPLKFKFFGGGYDGEPTMSALLRPACLPGVVYSLQTSCLTFYTLQTSCLASCPLWCRAIQRPVEAGSAAGAARLLALLRPALGGIMWRRCVKRIRSQASTALSLHQMYGMQHSLEATVKCVLMPP